MLRKYVAARLLQVVPVLFAIVTINFAIIHLAPGDPAIAIAGPAASQAYIDSIHRQFGFDRPLIEQYFIYIANLLQGNLGISVAARRPVVDVVAERIGATLLLVMTAWFVSLGLGIYLGTKAGMRRGSAFDRATSLSTLSLYSVPVFWLALMLVSLFALHFRIFPISGMADTVFPNQGVALVFDVGTHMVLPIVSMIAFYMPQFYQLTRSSVAETLEEDFVKTLQATGLQKTSIFSRYVLKNASLPTITLAGLWLGYSLTGAVLIEVIFAWPGLGRLLFDSAISRDYPVLLGVFLVASTMVVLVALLTDLLYVYLDPRVRLGRETA
jgi:peptide/nickel transport system permease protein